MDSAFYYCRSRKRLEDAAWRLADQLNVVTWRAMQLHGLRRPLDVIAIRSEHTETKAELSEARYRPGEHRNAHGC